jgi:hypothetical protein
MKAPAKFHLLGVAALIFTVWIASYAALRRGATYINHGGAIDIHSSTISSPISVSRQIRISSDNEYLTAVANFTFEPFLYLDAVYFGSPISFTADSW